MTSALESTPESPGSAPSSTPPSTSADKIETSSLSPDQALRIPTLRSSSDISVPPTMTASSTPLGALNAARRPGPAPPQPSLASMRAGGLPNDIGAKMRAFHLSRQGAPVAPIGRPSNPTSISTSNMGPGSGQVSSGAVGGTVHSASPTTPSAPGGPLVGSPGGLKLPPSRPQAQNWTSAPAVPMKKGLSARRGMKMPGGLPGTLSAAGPVAGAGLSSDNPTINAAESGGSTGAGASGNPSSTAKNGESGSLFDKFSEFVDTKKGTLNFAGKATIHGGGIDFSSGGSFKISLDEVDNLEELGKGNYGTVYKVRHSRPQMRRPGLGLQGNKAPLSNSASSAVSSSPINSGPAESNGEDKQDASAGQAATKTTGATTGIVMAMKEIRLELDEAKFAAIIMELDILHRCISPFIVDFYGAFFQEGAVYICLEFMDGGSVDKLYGDGVPEGVLQKITAATVLGLKVLKEKHNIIHRDVKPTNILVNSRGQVKICDFGVSGNLVASIAKTNIGCQSYMAPERIASGGVAQAGANPGGGTYSVQSDVWSLGLTVIECALGRYPYPPETYNNIFSQLSAIVDGDPPDLPAAGFSDAARDFVHRCLHKVPKLRPTYGMLINHPWLTPLMKPPSIQEEDEDVEDTVHASHSRAPETADQEVANWVMAAMERRRSGTMGKQEKPALHAVSLDAVSSPSADTLDGTKDGVFDPSEKDALKIAIEEYLPAIMEKPRD
ncbi:MAG: hypothetical protein M1812_002049 [Candelaria pacifica]|nr:MAG: hypothetical protein M1812_002049 [Candelaria pacifica]